MQQQHLHSYTNSSSKNTLDVMLAQEPAYLASDYLAMMTASTTTTDHTANDSPADAAPTSTSLVDADCRLKMADWCDRCVDFCKFDREIVEITLNYLDRFVSTPDGQSILRDRNEFQLAVMAALYTAIKIHQAEAVSSKSISALSKGRYGQDDIEAMEARMIFALRWRMNPVTVSAFVRSFIDQIPQVAGIDTKTLYRLAKIQTDAAVRDYAFVTIRPSVIAYSAILNAVEASIMAQRDDTTSTSASHPVYGVLQTFLEQHLSLAPHDVEGIQKYLYASIATNTTTTTATCVDGNHPPTTVNRRRPPTPAAANDDDDDDVSDTDAAPESGSFKVRRIASTDSPRSTAAAMQ
jgi:hypothetical protein